jgi:hypothetical protein
VKILSCGEQSVNFDEENVSENRSMQHGINTGLQDPSNPLEYFELCEQEIAEGQKKKNRMHNSL